MAISNHLVQRGKHGRWYLRLAVPRALQGKWGKKERIKALGTSDRTLAERLALPILAEWRREEEIALSQPGAPVAGTKVPSLHDLEEAAVIAGFDLPRQEAVESRKLLRGAGQWLWDAEVGYLGHQLEQQRRRAATGDHTMVRELADDIVAALNFDLPRESAAYAQLCDLLNGARRDELKLQHEQVALGEVEAGTDSKLVRRVREREAAKARAGETIVELFERWASDVLAKGEKRQDTVNQDRKIIEQFAEFVGKDRAIRSITPVEVADYRDRLRELPPKWMSNKELRGLSMRDAAAKARKLGLAMTAFTTVNKHLSTISPLYVWLAAQPAWAGLVNPCNGLFHAKVKGKNPRPPFSTGTLNRILTSPLYTGFLGDGNEHVAGNSRADDWRFWAPLIAMFTGARIGEVAQLRVGDVRQERGVWFIHICHDEEAGLATKSRKSRPAAVHQTLIDIGFLKFHKEQQKRAGGSGSSPLFPELKPNKRGQISGTPSRWWRDYLTRIGVKNGADGYGAHSFRHTLADRFRSEAELLDDQIEVVLGHNQKTTTSGYGSLSQGTVSQFKEWMDGVQFEGVDFSHLVSLEGITQGAP